MKRQWRWLLPPLILLLTAAAVVPVFAQESASTAFSTFFIDASDMAFSQKTLSIQQYSRDAAGKFQPGDVMKVDCTLNEVTEDASFYIQPNTGMVYVTVDYLTDLNNDGIYELPQDDASPVWDYLSPQSSVALQRTSQSQKLLNGQTYILSAQTLIQGSQQAAKLRTQGGSSTYLNLSGSAQNFPLCLVRLHYSPSGGEEQVQSYYVKLYGRALSPKDVSPDDDYYEAVEYVLSKGYFSGMGNGIFQPGGLFTRAQLAQILWRMGGNLISQGCSFSDVDRDAWYYDAVSWCFQNGIMTGLSPNSFAPDAPLSQQQAALILYQFAQYCGVHSDLRGDLSAYPGGDNVSVWAKQGMEWAVGNGLLPVTKDNTLNPSASITRSQMAMVLYAYDGAFSLR